MRRIPLLPALLAVALGLVACSPAEVILQGGEAAAHARWDVDPEAGQLPPEATSVPILVQEVDCASGRPADGRVRVLDVDYGDDRIAVVIGVVPQAGDQACPSNPLTPFLLELDEPLGDRELVNGSDDPRASQSALADLPDDVGEGGTSLLLDAGEGVTEQDLFLVEALWARAVDASEFEDLGDLAPHPGGVLLVLGDSGVQRKLRPAALADPANWQLHEPEGYAGFVGPFSALEVLESEQHLVVTIGDHPHCANPNRPGPAQLQQHRRIGIQPAVNESCIDWFAVDLYVDDEGHLRGVVLELFGP